MHQDRKRMENNKLSYIPIFEMNGLDDKPLSTTRKVHIRRLNDLLHLSIERGDYPRARRAWSILVRCKEFDWKTKWRTGLLLLSDTSTSGRSQQEDGGKGEFLKKLMRHYPDEQESILQEIILHLANEGRFREALEELDLYLPSFPFQDNPVLLAYAGLMSIKLAMPSLTDEGPQWNNELLVTARHHLVRALDIDPDNAVAKAFSEEVTNLLDQSNSNKSQVLQEPASDDEMDVDNNDSSNRVREKRIRRTTNGD